MHRPRLDAARREGQGQRDFSLLSGGDFENGAGGGARLLAESQQERRQSPPAVDEFGADRNGPTGPRFVGCDQAQTDPAQVVMTEKPRERERGEQAGDDQVQQVVAGVDGDDAGGKHQGDREGAGRGQADVQFPGRDRGVSGRGAIGRRRSQRTGVARMRSLTREARSTFSNSPRGRMRCAMTAAATPCTSSGTQ